MSALVKMVESMLSDENGVSEETYLLLRDLCDSVDKDTSEQLRIIMKFVDATDGRFYLNDRAF